jgi:hypothetical protein
MARPKVYSKDEDLRGVPLDQEVVVAVDLSADQELDVPQDKGSGKASGDVELDSDIVQTLNKQIEDLKKSNETAQEQLMSEQQRARQAEQEAAQAARAAEQFRSVAVKSQGDQLKSALDAAQSEQETAKAAYAAALEAGNFVEAADHQAKMSRAAARIVTLENSLANFDDNADEPTRAAPAPQPRAVDVHQQIDSNPNFLPAEKTFLKSHPELLTDGQKNAELGVAYNRAMREGLSRGTPEYFAFIEQFMGYKSAKQEQRSAQEDDEVDDDSTRAAAPVRRDNSGQRQAVRPTQVKLTPAQRELAANMGISELGYARQFLKLQDEKKSNPEKYNQSR